MGVALQNNQVLAVVPARAGSKRLPNKNSMELCGKPLIQWTIEAALASSCIDDVVVSTDSESMARISKKCGASVPFLRPDFLAGDNATNCEVVLHLLKTLSEQGKNYKQVFILQPTSPLRAVDDIEQAWSLFKEKKADAVVSVSQCEHPPMWSNVLPDSGEMTQFLQPLLAFKDSGKNLPDSYRLNGAIYIFEVERLKQEKKFYFEEGIFAYKMPISRSVDIDTLVDFRFAESLLNS